jgi:lipopolysaccharide transport system ATP-binding protein
MTETVIRAENIGKRYVLGVGGNPGGYVTLRESMMTAVGSPWRRLRRGGEPSANGQKPDGEFWALRDVSFSIQQGEVVGIIGRNGAGKSTLLKILSRITEPTEGKISLHGRVASLLEVGTGFHQELTGRENIFLNGAILGMRRAEIKAKFDEIVAFAEVDKFLDTPVKRYSSGMYVRLAFAVAAHLEPEILIVDEVLAVGDIGFQRKCLNKMQDVGRSGRTVLFVSHSMPAITRLCSRGVLLQEGRVLSDGPISQVVSDYLGSGTGVAEIREWRDPAKAPGGAVVRLRAVRVRSTGPTETGAMDIRREVKVTVDFDVLEAGHELTPNFHFLNEEGVCVFITTDHDAAWRGQPRPCGRYASEVTIPGNFLAEGTLLVTVAISTLNPVVVHALERDAVAFQIVDSLDGNSARGDFSGHFPGLLRPLLEWSTRFEPARAPAREFAVPA